ncbi:MAG TPA: iron ABC transporter permease [Abditibacteriaceae bacterium]|jgi:iron complex transport system permease protein
MARRLQQETTINSTTSTSEYSDEPMSNKPMSDEAVKVSSHAQQDAMAQQTGAPTELPRAASGNAVQWMVLLGAFIVALTLAATLGAPVPLSDLWSHDAARAEVAQRIFWRFGGEWGLRPVRLLAGALVGASLATSGAALQAVFRNPLAEPYLLGISAGGALGAAVGVALQGSTSLRVLDNSLFDVSSVLAFGGAVAASSLVYVLGQRGNNGASAGAFAGASNRGGLLLTGVAVSSFLAALMALVVALSNRADLAQQIMFWMLGGLTRATSAQNAVLFVSFVAGLGTLLWSARDLNALRAGDEEAMSLGVPVVALHRRLLLAAALMSAAAVATAGLIGFVGLLAPHLIRLLFGSNARAMIPAAAVGGATLLVSCDALARSVVQPVELPVGIITALLGVPLFLFLARRS